MSNILLIADTHFGHSGPYTTFDAKCGTKLLRPHGSAEAGDEAMVDTWNSVVRPGDKVYHLGDISISKKHLPILDRLNGTKVLIKGNHDVDKLSVYAKYFKDVRGSHQLSGMLLTHIPVHTSSLARWGFNVHGHTHDRNVMQTVKYGWEPQYTLEEPDPRYFCVSVEQINYTPIPLEEIKRIRNERGI